MYYLALCACFRNTASYLREWVLFHTAQGVEHFFLYDNESTDDFRQVLAPFVAAGLVTVLPWAGMGQQQAIYDDALLRYGSRAKWIGFLDDDEFAYPSYGTNLKDRTVAEVLARYDAFGGLSVSWMLYGSGGQVDRQPGRVIERFLHRHPHVNPHQKCFVQPGRIARSLCIGHAFAGKEGFPVVDEKGRPIDSPLHTEPSTQVMRINHYLMKSRHEFVARRSQPLANTGKVTELPFETWFEHDRLYWSQVYDASALAVLPRITALEGQYQ